VYKVLGLCAALLLIFGLAGLWLWPQPVSGYHLEAGGWALEEAQSFQAAHPDAINPALDRALRHFARAVEIDPGNGYAYRRLGQAWLLAGDNEQAANALTRAVALRPDNPLAHVELGYAYDGLGQVERALDEYERGRYGPRVNEAIVNYLKVVDWKIAAGGGNEALAILNDKVLKLDPNCLPALYRAMKVYEGISPQAAKEFAEPLRHRLEAYPVEKVAHPTEPRLLAYWKQTLADLKKEGIWRPDTS
jgi:tetratricopeptide (TPR) repeat protein